MLHELYEYALSNGLTARPGFKPKRIKAYVCLGLHGEFLGIDPGPSDAVLCPDMGSAAQGSTKCNVLVEKRMIPLSDEKPLKRAFFLGALADAAKTIPYMGTLKVVLENTEMVSGINAALDDAKIKSGDMIGFKVDGIPLECMIDEWWPAFRDKQRDKKETAESRCFITGQLATPVATVPKISGLRSVGGHSSGDAIICFDKDAFCSYGLKQAENACVSEEAITAVNAAVTQLIAAAPTLCGAKWVHWYKEALPEDTPDAFDLLFGGEAADDNDVSNDDEHIRLAASLADAQASRLILSHRNGENIAALNDNIYYIMPVSGAGGRIMVRGWQQGSYENLHEVMTHWWLDLSLCTPNGNGSLRFPSLGRINYRLLKPQNSNRPVNERMKTELAGLEPQLIFSILNNNPLPDAAAARALQYIRSKLMDNGDGSVKREPVPDPLSCQILKAWLIRKEKKNDKGVVTMQETCNPERSDVAYQCGRMMAVYAAIQSRAMGKKLGAGVIQRYYTSASSTPALVFGRLSQLSQHHLAKIENRGAVVYYENLLSEISQKIGTQMPVTLNLRQQAEFTLGYYQQRAAMFAKNDASKSE